MSGQGPRQRRALSNLRGPVTRRGEPTLAKLLAETLERAAREEPDRLTHGFHTYPARMHPTVPQMLLEELAEEGAPILDPFCGGGTTLVEARVRGLPSTGTDLSPLALRIAEVKCRTPSDAELEAFRQALASVVAANEARVKARAPSRAPLSSEDARRYDPHVLREMAGLWEEVQAIDALEVRRALEILFSAIVVKFSRQRAETQEETAPRRIGRFVPTRFFARKGEELVRRWEALRAAVPPGAPAPRLVEGDARCLERLLPRGARFPLVISSPPYGGTYDYWRHHRLRFSWLGLDDEAMRRAEIGARRRLSRGADKAGAWDREVRDFLAALSARLDEEGLAVLLMGDAEVGGERVSADAQLEHLAPSVGLAFAAAASQRRKDWKGGPARAEHLVALRKASPRRSAGSG